MFFYNFAQLSGNESASKPGSPLNVSSSNLSLCFFSSGKEKMLFGEPMGIAYQSVCWVDSMFLPLARFLWLFCCLAKAKGLMVCCTENTSITCSLSSTLRTCIRVASVTGSPRSNRLNVERLMPASLASACCVLKFQSSHLSY